MYRIGIGYDTHIFSLERKFILGGLEIPYEKGLLGHSDADALTHAIMDAILGAAGLADIGHFFPDSDPAFKNVDSVTLLDEILRRIDGQFQVINIDAVILCERPKLKPHLPRIKENLSRRVKAPVNVKATTTEKMNAEGEGKCLSVQAVALLSVREVKSDQSKI